MESRAERRRLERGLAKADPLTPDERAKWRRFVEWHGRRFVRAHFARWSFSVEQHEAASDAVLARCGISA